MALFIRPFTALAGPQAARALAASSGLQFMSTASKDEELPKPTYTYQSPGSSMREPSLGTGHSLGNPTYEYDPKPRSSLADPLPSFAPTGTAKKAAAPRQPARAKTAAPAAKEPGLEAYVYRSPGSSVREASYGFSVRDPVYVVDPAPAANATLGARGISKHDRLGPTTLQAVRPAPPANKVRTGLAMDDLANSPFVSSSPRGSLAEPRYVSISDPQDAAAQRSSSSSSSSSSKK